MIATLTIGKRRAGMPSESGNMPTSCAALPPDASARSRTRCAKTQCGVSAPVRRSRRFGHTAHRPTIRVVNGYYTEVVMNTLLEAGETAKTELKRFRWALGLSGALAVAFGVALIIWPNLSLAALVIVFGAFSLARGI